MDYEVEVVPRRAGDWYMKRLAKDGKVPISFDIASKEYRKFVNDLKKYIRIINYNFVNLWASSSVKPFVG